MFRFGIVLAAACLLSVPLHAQAPSYPIKGEDGSPVLNQIISTDTGSEIRKLPDVVGIGNPKGDVTIYEFYDLNCPYCRKAAADLAAMMAADKRLEVVLVPFPVLGIPSIQAGRVEFALARLASPQQFHAFHQKIFTGRGTVDGERALSVAREIGFAREKILEVANSESVTEAMKAHVKIGDRLKMQATPSFVVHDVAIIGYPGRAAMEAIVRSVRTCRKAVC